MPPLSQASHKASSGTSYTLALSAPVHEPAVDRLVDKTKDRGRGGRPVTRLACAKALAAVSNDEV